MRRTDIHPSRSNLRDLRQNIDMLSGRLDALQALLALYLERTAGADEEKVDQAAAAARPASGATDD